MSRTKFKAYDLILQSSTKTWQKKSGAFVDDVYDSPWFAYKSLMFILDSITPRETKETGAEQTKNTESENSETMEENNDVSTFLFHLIMFYIIFINVSLIKISTIISIYFDMELNLQLSKLIHELIPDLNRRS